jgi:hypothetical protein
MAKKTFKITIGTKTKFVRLDEAYTSIATEAGLELAVAGDIVNGDNTEKQAALISSGILFQLSVGFENGKRGRIVISSEKLATLHDLEGTSFKGKTIKSASLRTYSKIAA